MNATDWALFGGLALAGALNIAAWLVWRAHEAPYRPERPTRLRDNRGRFIKQ